MGAGNCLQTRAFSNLANICRIKEAQTVTSEKRVIDVERENVKMNPGALSWKQVSVCMHSFQYERENYRCRNVRYGPAYRVRACK